MTPNLALAINILIALLPAILWAYIFFDDARRQYRKLYLVIFVLSLSTVLPVLGFHKFYDALILKFPVLDIFGRMQLAVGASIWIIFRYLGVGIAEELAKFYIVKVSDKRHPELITNINQALKFGILSGLGFATVENVFYIQSILASGLAMEEKIVTFLFRAIFVVCAHVCWTGILSYFYGISKFSQDFVNFKKWQGKKIAINEYQKIRFRFLATGLSLSIILHAMFDIFMELSHVNPLNIAIGPITVEAYMVLGVISIIIMFLMLQYFLSRNVGNLTFILADRHKSTMAKKDTEVVLELMGMWYKEGRYEEVKEISERLLQRDPDNNVVKLFQAKIQEKLKL